MVGALKDGRAGVSATGRTIADEEAGDVVFDEV
jgi:hypothetical protein